MAIINSSIMCMDFLKLEESIKILNDQVDYFHADLMDGHYVPNLTLSPDFIAACSAVTTKPIEAHLMMTDPMSFIDSVAKAGAAIISLHADVIQPYAFRAIRAIQNLGCEAGVVLNPATPLSAAEAYLGQIKILTLMTVDAGYAGQPFVPQVLNKIAAARELKEKSGYNYIIQVDGACNKDNYLDMLSAGAEAFVMGSTGLFGLNTDLNLAVKQMHEELAAAKSGLTASKKVWVQA